MEDTTLAPKNRLLAKVLALASAGAAGLMAAGALAAPAQGYANYGSWNTGCRSGWDSVEAVSMCNSNGHGVGQVKLTIDRAVQVDYNGDWKNAVNSDNVDGPIFCTWSCRTAAVSRSGV